MHVLVLIRGHGSEVAWLHCCELIMVKLTSKTYIFPGLCVTLSPVLTEGRGRTRRRDLNGNSIETEPHGTSSGARGMCFELETRRRSDLLAFSSFAV